MADYNWPAAADRSLIGKPLSRLDGPVKSTGAAKYPSDLRRDGMLHAKVLTCPHAHARIKKIDVAKAKAMPGVAAVRVIQDVGAEIQWAFDEVAAVAADHRGDRARRGARDRGRVRGAAALRARERSRARRPRPSPAASRRWAIPTAPMRPPRSRSSARSRCR